MSTTIRLVTDLNYGRPGTAPVGLTSEAPHEPFEVAISLIKPFNGPPVVSSFCLLAMPFVAAAFHTIEGTKFTVNYAVDAKTKQMNK